MEWVNQWDARTWISLRKVSSFPFPTMASFYRFQQTFQFYFTYFARHRLFLKFSFEILQGKLARGRLELIPSRMLDVWPLCWAWQEELCSGWQTCTSCAWSRIQNFTTVYIDCLQHLLDGKGNIFLFQLKDVCFKTCHIHQQNIKVIFTAWPSLIDEGSPCPYTINQKSSFSFREMKWNFVESLLSLTNGFIKRMY